MSKPRQTSSEFAAKVAEAMKSMDALNLRWRTMVELIREDGVATTAANIDTMVEFKAFVTSAWKVLDELSM